MCSATAGCGLCLNFWKVWQCFFFFVYISDSRRHCNSLQPDFGLLIWDLWTLQIYIGKRASDQILLHLTFSYQVFNIAIETSLFKITKKQTIKFSFPNFQQKKLGQPILNRIKNATLHFSSISVSHFKYRLILIRYSTEPVVKVTWSLIFEL